jgi:hypothetical protein
MLKLGYEPLVCKSFGVLTLTLLLNQSQALMSGMNNGSETAIIRLLHNKRMNPVLSKWCSKDKQSATSAMTKP